MDKNAILGSLLIGVLVIGYFFISKPSEEDIIRQRHISDSIQQVEFNRQLRQQAEEQQRAAQNDSLQHILANNDSAAVALLRKDFGAFAHAATGKERITSLSNNRITLQLSNKGGKPFRVFLNDFQTYHGAPLQLLSGDSTQFGFLLSEIGKSTDELFFEPSEIFVDADSTQTIRYRLAVQDSSYIEFEYTLPKNSYRVDVQINTPGMSRIVRDSRYQLLWKTYILNAEKSRDAENQNTNIVWKYYQDDVERTDARTKDPVKEDLSGQVHWIGFKQHFFSSIILAPNNFERGGNVESVTLPEGDSALKVFTATVFLPKTESNEISFYFGPNHYPTLKAQGEDLEQILDLGWFGFITRFAIIPIFNWLSSFLANYGLIILLLTIILKMVLFPLTFKSYLSTARMRVLKPQVDEINARYTDKGDAMKRQQATMELYRKAGVNPMGGCLPLLIQFPILIAMFRFFPASIELRQQSFLWADDLSTYDAIVSWTTNIPLLSSIYGNHISLFTLLMAGSMIMVNQLNTANVTTTPGMPNMKVMMWIMSIMMIFWFNNYSAGLSYYYFLANCITLLQTYIIRRMVDDKKILAKIEAHKKTPKKKSRFQTRLDEMMKQQQQLQKGRK
ncbi:MAG: membrane protein insertase YidC [Bacteroidales bacterium]|jgi:YidC/Oxa1 family membrane protein insertase|nr:membrane protein insertase YidC [Bacteroidales bacterium]